MLSNPMSGWRANDRSSTQDTIALRPRHYAVDVSPQTTLQPFDSCDTIVRPAWQANAACRGVGPEIFFPARGDNTLALARCFCARCPVAEECRAVALRDPSLQGIWAGMSEQQRDRLRSSLRMESITHKMAPSVSKGAAQRLRGVWISPR
jgi:hypothetical protein